MKRISFSALLIFAVISCAKNTLSERDAKREQLKSAAENKRQELAQVAGAYHGNLFQSTGSQQPASISLEIKDVPTPVEGQVDPVLMPILAGFLKFDLGAGSESQEYIGFSVEKADFDPKLGKLDLVVSNVEYKEILLSLVLKGQFLDGSWTAPTTAASGTAKFERGSLQSGGLAEQIRGDYGAVLLHDAKNQYQFAQLTLNTSIQSPQGLKVSGTLRVIFGNWDSSEYLTYRFDPIQFNPVSGQMVLKAEGSDIVVTGFWANGNFVGEWSSSYTGKLGATQFKKNTIPSSVGGKDVVEALKGSYQGTVKNTNPQCNLPERLMVSFVTSQDLTKPNGISVTGNMRLYLGDFGSNEYFELPVSDIQYNFFTRKLVMKTTGDYKLTLKGESNQKEIIGIIAADALGECGSVEVKKI